MIIFDFIIHLQKKTEYSYGLKPNKYSVLKNDRIYIFIPEIKKAVAEKRSEIKAYVVGKGMKEFTITLGDLTDDESKLFFQVA